MAVAVHGEGGRMPQTLALFLAAALVDRASCSEGGYCSEKFEDCSHTDCCADEADGFKCFRKNPYYSGCHKECPDDWDCTPITESRPDCAKASENCDHLGCCQDPGYKCYTHNAHWAQCKKTCPDDWDCTEITEETKKPPMPKVSPSQAEEEVQEEDDGIPKLRATHFWDCNGGGCDAPVLQPWDEKKYVYAPQYAPADPKDYGGSMYGEKLWMTGAASDKLSQKMGPDRENCGYSTEGGGGCGQCLIVRNPYARNPNWTAVVMKKNRCPPESPGCHKAHMDLAVPGFDLLHVSLSNVCGKRDQRTDTYITAEQSGICGSVPAHSCDCSGIPDDTPERAMLRKGCELFKAWGWHHGAPLLNYQPVECPPAFVERVRVGKAFNEGGVIGLAAQEPRAEVVPSRKASPLPFAVAGALAAAALLTAAAMALRRRQEPAAPELLAEEAFE